MKAKSQSHCLYSANPSRWRVLPLNNVRRMSSVGSLTPSPDWGYRVTVCSQSISLWKASSFCTTLALLLLKRNLYLTLELAVDCTDKPLCIHKGWPDCTTPRGGISWLVTVLSILSFSSQRADAIDAHRICFSFSSWCIFKGLICWSCTLCQTLDT